MWETVFIVLAALFVAAVLSLSLLFLLARLVARKIEEGVQQASSQVRDRTIVELRRRGVREEDIERRLKETFRGAGAKIVALAEARGINILEAKAIFFAKTNRLANVLDSAVKLPLIGGIGLDAVLGLFPVIGELASNVLAVLIVINSLQFGIPPRLVLAMTRNIVVDAVIGLIPGIGDIADVFYRANTRNMALLRAHIDARSPAPEMSRSSLARVMAER
jgi:hypothetical protein